MEYRYLLMNKGVAGGLYMSVDQSYFQQLNYSKYCPPKTHPLYFVRERLLKRLDKIGNHKYTLLQAPEGYGKSSLLSDWYHRVISEEDKMKCIWFRVDSYDSEPRCFWGNLIEAMEDCWPGIKTAAVDSMDLLEQSSPLQLILSVANHIVKNSEDDLQYVLVFDDFEEFKLSNSEGQFFLFADMLPANVNFVIASKEYLNNRLVDQDAYSKFMMLGIADLAIARSELEGFLNLKGEFDISDDLLDAIYAKTEGWPLALYSLLEEVRDGTPIEAATKNLSGADGYFGGTVFQKATNDLSQKVMMFLLETSFFERFSTPMCNYVFDNNGADAIVQHIERSGMFLFLEDSNHTRYRYHHLFAEWLRSQALSLHRDQIRIINHKAALWYHNNDEELLSAKHIAVASEGNFISDLTKCVFTKSRIRDSDYFSWLLELKESELIRNPFFCLLAAWAYVFSGKPRGAREWLKHAIDHVEKGTTNAAGESQQPQVAKEGNEDEAPYCVELDLEKRMKLVSAIIESKILTLEGNSKTGIEKAQLTLTEHGPFLDDRLKMVLYQNLGEAYELSGNQDSAAKYFQRAMTIAQVNRYDFLVGFTRYQSIRIAFAQGKLSEAEKLCRTALIACPPDFTVYGALYSMLGLIEIMQNKFEELETIMKRAFRRVSPYRNIDIYLEACIARTRFLMMGNNYSEALLQIAVSRQAIINNRDIPPRGTAPLAYGQHAQLYIRLRDFDSAQDIMQEYESLNYPKTVEGELRQIIINATIKIEKRTADETTIADLEKCIAKAEKCKLVLYQVEICLIMVRLYYYMENHAEAVKFLKKSIDLAKREQMIQLFLDEGEVIRLLLTELVGSRGLSYDSEKFARKLIEAFDYSNVSQEKDKPFLNWAGDSSENTNDPIADHWGLTSREGEVLQLLIKGMNRKEIAAELCTSQNTAKTHISHIYEKMNVHSVSELLREMVEHGAL